MRGEKAGIFKSTRNELGHRMKWYVTNNKNAYIKSHIVPPTSKRLLPRIGGKAMLPEDALVAMFRHKGEPIHEKDLAREWAAFKKSTRVIPLA